MPLPFCLLLSFVGIYLMWRTSKERLGKFMVTLGVLLICIFSITPFANYIAGPLESQYVPFNGIIKEYKKEDIKYVVVLGGGHVYDSSIPASSRVNNAALVRLVEGIKIFREFPGSILLLSGGGINSPGTDAGTMLDVALAMGVKGESIIIEADSKDTKDQARFIKGFVKSSPFVMVTSAAHMKRSVVLFEKMGMKPLPAPTNYLVRDDGRPHGFGYVVPHSQNIRKVESALHEYLGIVWAYLRGQI